MIQQTDYSQEKAVETGAKEQPSGLVRPHLAAIQATVTGLDNPLIPFALLNHDPCPAFHQYIEACLQAEEGRRNTLCAACEAWQRPFAHLHPEQLFFVLAWGSVTGASSRVMQSAGLVFSITTPGLLQRRWCTTLPMMRQGELVAWCFEIDMSEASQTYVAEVVFSEENMLRLA